MTRKMLSGTALTVLMVLLAAGSAPSEALALSMPALFSDQMVVQRDMAVPVWGRASPGEEIEVDLAGHRKVARADADGTWRLELDPLPAGGPHELVVRGRDDELRFVDVLVGEVWLASGQSNMEMPLAGWGRILDYEIEIARADYPAIRFFQVERATAMQPVADVRGIGWQRASPETAADFSSTAYFFARRVHRETGLPIGIIHSSWGGTVAEAWTSAESLETLDEFRDRALEIRTLTGAEIRAMREEFERAMAERQRAVREDDAGMEGGTPAWAARALDDSDWPAMMLPAKWEDQELPELDGVVWFRREIELPESWSGHGLLMSLGPIDDGDETFVNGVRVGETEGWDVPRRYEVPASLVAAGRNVLAVRVVDTYLGGGLWGEPSDLHLLGPGGERIELAGRWEYRVGVELEPLPISPDDPNLPTVLYNAMIRPLAPYAIRGVIWYQGESNSSRAFQYRTLFQTLIRDWRSLWGQGDFPFYFVQLAAFEPGILERDKWPELREAQAMALALPGTGMAVAIDIGNPRDVHPKNKQEVGNRLARLALKRVYGREIVDSGPLYREMRPEGARIRLLFEHAAGGLEAKGGALAGFTIAGDDREFRPAHARIEDESVVVWSPSVQEPVAVRYGWADAPECNLYNASGLPASPFRTDDWPGLTERR